MNGCPKRFPRTPIGTETTICYHNTHWHCVLNKIVDWGTSFSVCITMFQLIRTLIQSVTTFLGQSHDMLAHLRSKTDNAVNPSLPETTLCMRYHNKLFSVVKAVQQTTCSFNSKPKLTLSRTNTCTCYLACKVFLFLVQDFVLLRLIFFISLSLLSTKGTRCSSVLYISQHLHFSFYFSFKRHVSNFRGRNIS